jgi:two-component system NtrC family sensor kinase
MGTMNGLPPLSDPGEMQHLGFLEDLKKQWMAMIDAVSDPLAIVDEDFSILRQNRAYLEACATDGLAITDLKGKRCYEVFAGRNSPCSHCRLHEVRQTGSSLEWQCSDELKVGRSHVVRLHPLQGPPGHMRFVAHYRDVTESLALGENLAHADKLAALGKLAGGVAHEINSPLAGIMAFTQMLLKEIPSDDPHREDLEEIEDAARKCKVIVENLLGFARQDKPAEVFSFNVLDALESTLRLSKAVLKRAHVDVLYERPTNPESFQMNGRSGKIGQVFLNLMTNAIQAMGDRGGWLRIGAAADDASIRLTFEDNGPGMAPETMKRIFDPFFTTKPVGHGTGLGLSISYAIIKQHGGSITADSELERGSCFSIVLPRSSDVGEGDEL